MAGLSKEELLKIPQAVEEIKRHLWIESEQAGYDIGFDNAADDWIKKYSLEWLKYFMPEKIKSSPGSCCALNASCCAPAKPAVAEPTGLGAPPPSRATGSMAPSAFAEPAAPSENKTDKRRSAKSYK
ncbi:MAG: hypothetical protein HQL23_04195 [Candidatus Omnitrophica bacterium]|nr:hypothetical protein [Candidatus Omnitrophota bacterium]